MLAELIRNALDQEPNQRDPRTIARRVAGNADPELVRALLAEAAVDRVRDMMSQRRTTALNNITNPAPDKPHPSSKVAAIRDWWQQFLNTTYHVDGAYVAARDMSAEDWDLAAMERHQIAAATVAEAVKLEKIAALLREYGAATIAELDESRVRAALGGAA